MPRKRKKKNPRKRGRKKGFLFPLLLFFLVVLTLGATLYFMFIGPGGKGTKKRAHLQYEQSPAVGEFNLPPVKQAPASPTVQEKRPAPAIAPRIHLVAIVIDDMGYQRALGRRFLAIDQPLSFSFLPYAPFTKLLMREARSRHRDILLHVPLEPHDSSLNIGPGALLTAMPAATITRIFNEDLAQVPLAIGVNNHMGSKFTESRAAMTPLLTAVKRHGLFFLDSLTTPHSVGFKLAEEMKIPAARRNVFLDNQDDRASVLKQLDLLVRLSRRHGSAIGIAHPKAGSLAAIQQFVRQIPPDIELTALHRLIL